jgi:Ca2+-dependent lipid-binding protein
MAQLQVTIIEGRNLKKQDWFSDNDAFVQIYLDDKKQKEKSKVISNSKTPQWNQTFVLYVHFHFLFSDQIPSSICLVIIFTVKIFFMLMFMIKI